ncbi:MAG: hypothetical protein ACO2PM_23175 [Pyrobaculum sp.]
MTVPTAVGKSSASSTLTAAQAHSENTKFRNSTARYSWAAAQWTAARATAVARPPAKAERKARRLERSMMGSNRKAPTAAPALAAATLRGASSAP